MFTLSLEARLAAEAHAVRAYPKEACGLVVDGAYLPCFNYAVEPERDFVIAGEVQAKLHEQGKTIQAIVHSHPDGPLFPSEADMVGQIASDLPWVIVPTNGEQCADPIIWGEGVERAPILGRVFRHGVTDCYELVRDTFAAGKDELARQGVTTEWPIDPVFIPPQARADGWWSDKTECENRSLYEGFAAVGFRKIAQSDVVPGDCFIMRLGHGVTTPSHGGIYLGKNLILHHLPTRVSRREPAGIWIRAVDTWLRHEAVDAHLASQDAAHA